MISMRTKLSLAVVASVACVSSMCGAQEEPRGEAPDSPDSATRAYRKETEQPEVGTTRLLSAEYNERASAEQGRYTGPNRTMLVTGAALFGVPYVAGVLVAAQSPLDADKRNFIPLVGPWLDLGQRACAFGGECSTSDNVGSAFLVGSGVAQGVGIIMAAVSFVAPSTAMHLEPPRSKMMVLPMSFASGGGVGAAGTF